MIVTMLDYGTGNLGSWRSFLREYEVQVRVANQVSGISSESVILLPGVGSAREAMPHLVMGAELGELHERAKRGQPIVGVCLGAQLLLGENEEMGGRGLGLVPGEVKRVTNGRRFNIGWDEIVIGRGFEGSTIAQFGGRARFYFNHQYALHLSAPDVEFAEGVRSGLVAVFREANVWGIQFHPEKSQEFGYDFFGAVLDEIRREDV